MTLDKIGAMNLVVAVFNQAKADYIYLKANLANPNDKTACVPERCGAGNNLQLIEDGLYTNIILSDFLYMLNIEPEDVIKNWNEQGMHERWRVQHECNKCEKKGCIYKEAGHYTVKPYECIKVRIENRKCIDKLKEKLSI